MEPIKIVDKLTLRQEALRMALQTVYGVNVSENLKDLVLRRAADIAEYIQGSADLPEYVDPNADKQQWVDMLNKMREEMKPNPWISVDSEMKPALNQKVLVMCEDYESPILGEYLADDSFEIDTPDGVHNDILAGIKVVAWMPIPPFTQPIKM